MENNPPTIPAVPDKKTRPDGSDIFNKEILSNQIMRGETQERLYWRKIIITPEADEGREVYLGLIRYPADEEEAERVNSALEVYAVITDDLFLPPDIAVEIGQALVMSAHKLKMEEDDNSPEMTVSFCVSMTLPRGANPNQIGRAISDSLRNAVPKGSQVYMTTYEKDAPGVA